MDKKTIAIISYISIIGWLVAFFVSKKENEQRSPLVIFHLKQALGLAIVSIIFSVLVMIIASIVPALAFLSYFSYAFIILWIIGILNAAAEKMSPLPLIGNMFRDKFSFIN